MATTAYVLRTTEPCPSRPRSKIWKVPGSCFTADRRTAAIGLGHPALAARRVTPPVVFLIRSSMEDEVPLRDRLRQAVSLLPKAVRFRAENVFIGFERAHLLLPFDREMASFRAITAEEEAAAALFTSLKMRRYPGAEKLNVRDHQHKAAVAPFLSAVRRSIAHRNEITIEMTLDWAQPSLTVAIALQQLGVEFPGSEGVHLQIDHPLNVARRIGATQEIDRFESDVLDLANSSAFSSVAQMVAKSANARNTLLYASDSALPRSQVTEAGIERRQESADLCLYLCVAIMQTDVHQTLALQALDGFLRVIGKLPDQPLHYPPDADDYIQIAVHPDRPSVVTVKGDPSAAAKAHAIEKATRARTD